MQSKINGVHKRFNQFPFFEHWVEGPPSWFVFYWIIAWVPACGIFLQLVRQYYLSTFDDLILPSISGIHCSLYLQKNSPLGSKPSGLSIVPYITYLKCSLACSYASRCQQIPPCRLRWWVFRSLPHIPILGLRNSHRTPYAADSLNHYQLRELSARHP